MNRFLLLSACCLSLSVSAAIITERNDVYLEGRWCLTPPQYTFVGTPSHPGIESCWIPYGTYTDGVGGTEYTRVTSNLMGVVASALEGFAERRNCGWGVDHPNVMMRPATLPEGAVHEGHWRYIDDGSFLSSLTNCSLRIADQLNRPLMYAIPYDYTNVYYYTDAGYDGIELALLKDALDYYGSRRLEALTGNAEPPISSEWSPNLPYNVADSNLWRNVYPQFAFCTNDIYFLPDSSRYSRTRMLPNPNPGGWGSLEGLWGEDFGYALGNLNSALEDMSLAVTIEDVLSYDSGLKYEYPPRLTNDYWTVNGIQLDRWYCEPSDGWSNLNHSSADWEGADSNQWYAVAWNRDSRRWQYAESSTGVSIFVDASPNAKQIDFGNGIVATKTEFYADTDDYCHFTNGTTRLDWKRLGIICQLERQMDTTYEASEHEDTLPLWHLDTLHELWYESSSISITFPIPQGDGQEMPPAAGLLRNVSWNNDYDYYSSTTNEYKTIWSTPTCRTPAPQCAGEMYFDGYLGTDIYLEYEDASNIVSKLCSELSQSITGELSHVFFYGDWNPGAGMNLDFNAYYAEGTVIIKHPSNTVEVSSSDGFHASEWTYDDIDRHAWDFTNGTTSCDVRFDWGGYVPGGTYIDYRKDNHSEDVYYEDNLHFGLPSGSISVPQVTLSAIGSGDITNWTWQVSDLPGVSSNLVSGLPSVSYDYIEHADGTIDTNLVCRWDIGNYAGGYGHGGKVKCTEFLSSGESQVGWELQSDDVWQGSTYMFIWYTDAERALSRSYTSPSIDLTWNSDYYTTEEEVSHGGELQGDSIPIHWNPESTNATGYAYSTIHKTTSPTFTFASPETRALTISNFAWKNSALDWSRIYSLRRSELELLLSARDVPSFAADESPSPGNFTWAEINDIPHSDRQFRMLQGAAAQSLSNADTAQYNLLAGLSAACKTKCEDIGGMPIGAIDDVGKVSQSESAAFLADFNNAKVRATFSISGSSGMVFQADVLKEGDSYVVDAIDTPVHFPYYVGGCGWNCYVDYQQSVSITNQYRDARVDAHQAPVRKTVWKFKNLRDPNL